MYVLICVGTTCVNFFDGLINVFHCNPFHYYVEWHVDSCKNSVLRFVLPTIQFSIPANHTVYTTLFIRKPPVNSATSKPARKRSHSHLDRPTKEAFFPLAKAFITPRIVPQTLDRNLHAYLHRVQRVYRSRQFLSLSLDTAAPSDV